MKAFLQKLKIKFVFKILIIFLVLLISVYRLNIKETNINKDIVITGTIERLILKDEYGEIWLKSTKKYLVYSNDITLIKSLKLGDKIKVEGTLSLASENRNFNLFNYSNYLKSKNISYVIKDSKISYISSSTDLIFKLKNFILRKIADDYSSPYLKAFILADTSELKYLDTYQFLGISHLFAISGMHVILLVTFLKKLFKNCHFKSEIFIEIIFFACYLKLILFPISALRATIVYFFNRFQKEFKLNISKKEFIIILFLLFLLYNPFFIYDIGFGYSFVISYFLTLRKTNIKGIKNLFMTSLFCLIISIPLTAYSTYQINLFSPFYNLLAIPLVSFILFPLAFLTLFIPLLKPGYSFCIKIFENLFTILASHKLLILTLAKPNLCYILIYYLIIIIYLKYHKKLYIFILICLIFFLAYKPYFALNPTIYFLDVDQGDAALVVLPFGKSLLIDTGGVLSYKKENHTLTYQTLIPFFKSLGLKKIDTLILSHGDADHMNEALPLIQNFPVAKVIFNNNEYNSLETNLLKYLDSKNILHYQNVSFITLGKTKFYFLNTKVYQDENNSSNVIYFKFSNYQFLFMGDAAKEKEEDILKKYKLSNIDVLKVGHHGSKTSSSKNFIDAINPKYAIISVGQNNNYGHPNRETLKNLENSKIFRTDLNGGIMVKIINHKLIFKTCLS